MESKKKEQQQAKLKESKLKKQEKIIVRNDHQDIEDDFEEIEVQKEGGDDSNTKQVHQTPRLKEMLMSPLGIVCLIGFFITSFVLIHAAFFEDNVEAKKKD